MIAMFGIGSNSQQSTNTTNSTGTTDTPQTTPSTPATPVLDTRLFPSVPEIVDAVFGTNLAGTPQRH